MNGATTTNGDGPVKAIAASAKDSQADGTNAAAGVQPASQLHRAARWYAAHGIAVFPCSPRSKIPLAGSRGWHDATTDADTIDVWWRQTPDANVAIALKPSGLLVVDIDERHGGRDSLAALERQHGALPATWHEQTGARLTGDHYVFRLPAETPTTVAKPSAGVDVLAIGYIVCAPSVHPNGGVYRWCLGEGPLDLALTEAPLWAVEALSAEHADRLPVVDELVVVNSHRNRRLFQLGALLRRHGVNRTAIEAALTAINRAHCTPPLDAGEVRKIAGSAARYQPSTEAR